MDPLFERRELVRNIHVEARFLQRNIAASILAQLRMKYEGICVAEGYIQRRSINIRTFVGTHQSYQRRIGLYCEFSS